MAKYIPGPPISVQTDRQMKNRRLLPDQDVLVPNAEILGMESYLTQESRGQLTVLDLGCGEGANSLYLASMGHRVTAVDSQKSSLAELRHIAASLNLSIKTIHTDVQHLLLEEHYDLILCYGLLHFLTKPERKKIIEKIKSATSSGGQNLYAVSPIDKYLIDRSLRKQGHKQDFDSLELVKGYEMTECLLYQSYLKFENHKPDGLHAHRIEKYIFQPANAAPRVCLGLTPPVKSAARLHLSEVISGLKHLVSIDDAPTIYGPPRQIIRYPLNGFFECVEFRVDIHADVTINSVDGKIIGLHAPISVQYLLPRRS